ncbi:MAG: hypothetical protein VBE63_14600 [Lamprobacter sp.]|uniref:hypothetical protein n=1 Tax=Lamprobacter sp. TaxID=3100796 RepID=UPI002B26091B|nr:hypothetical protein [Lamprobacter sp.]MEA3641153.1 hypothetical protein [Lamprobacter sp.]
MKLQLESMGIKAETRREVAPVVIHEAASLAEAYGQLGRNPRLGLSGLLLRSHRELFSDDADPHGPPAAIDAIDRGAPATGGARVNQRRTR